MTTVKVYKQAFDTDEIELNVSSVSFKIIHVGWQGDVLVPTIWYETNPKSPSRENIKFVFIGTGETIPDNSFHVGSTLCGDLVWHVYQKRK